MTTHTWCAYLCQQVYPWSTWGSSRCSCAWDKRVAIPSSCWGRAARKSPHLLLPFLMRSMQHLIIVWESVQTVGKKTKVRTRHIVIPCNLIFNFLSAKLDSPTRVISVYIHLFVYSFVYLFIYYGFRVFCSRHGVLYLTSWLPRLT